MPQRETSLVSLGWRDLWEVVNRPRSFDHHPVRLGCSILLIVYGTIAIVRHHPEHPEFLAIRAVVCLYALLGVILAPFFTWNRLRAYTVGLAFLLPLGSAYIDGTLGNDPSQLPLTALGTFAPLVFLQVGRDLLLVSVCLVVGHATLLFAVLPPPSVAPTTVMIVIGGAIATGTAAGAILLVYRSRLQQSLTWLQEALHAKSEFLNTMSHELRSPIHVIIGYTDMVREEGVSTSAEHALDRIRASALELLQLVENTMNAARLEAGKVPLRLEEFAPAELARELADGIRALPEASRGVAVRWDVESDLPPLRLDRLNVKEIVQNLVSNALKFTAEGEVCVSLRRDGDRLRIAVSDTGVGIPAEAQARIFGMFERVERNDGPAPAGVGLGLYIVNRLVELMRGRAALTSAPGAGSCFTVQLPLRLD